MVLDLFFFFSFFLSFVFLFLLRPSAGIPHTHTPHPSTLFSCSCCCTILGGGGPGAQNLFCSLLAWGKMEQMEKHFWQRGTLVMKSWWVSLFFSFRFFSFFFIFLIFLISYFLPYCLSPNILTSTYLVCIAYIYTCLSTSS